MKIGTSMRAWGWNDGCVMGDDETMPWRLVNANEASSSTSFSLVRLGLSRRHVRGRSGKRQ